MYKVTRIKHLRKSMTGQSSHVGSRWSSAMQTVARTRFSAHGCWNPKGVQGAPFADLYHNPPILLTRNIIRILKDVGNLQTSNMMKYFLMLQQEMSYIKKAFQGNIIMLLVCKMSFHVEHFFSFRLS